MTPPELAPATSEAAWVRRWGLTAVLAVGAVARLPPLFLGVEHYGDAPVRIEAAERWIADPHLWLGFGEAFQYGPLHLTLLGLAVKLLARFAGPELLSYAFGLGCLWLLHRITRRASGEVAALAAGLSLALSPLHIQASTTGASEAVFLGLLLAAVCIVLEGRSASLPVGRAALAGGLIGLGCLVRYDGLLYAGLLAALLLWDAAAARRPTQALPAIAFSAAALALPALWFWQCARVDGHPFAALRHINADHRMLAAAAVQWFGELRYRLYCLGYWPAAILLICTPLAGFFALAGAARALFRLARSLPRPPDAQETLALLAWLPAAYFTARGALLVNFRPMARFALVAAALSLPLAWDVLRDLTARLSQAARRAILALTAAALVGAPVALALVSVGRDGNLAEWARPIGPISSVPPGIDAAARWMGRASPADVVLLDGTWHYLDIVLAFEAALPEAQVVRRSWPDFEAKLARRPPTLAVVLEGGSLRALPGSEQAVPGAPSFAFRGLRFCAEAHFVYASVYRRCPPSAATPRQ